MSAPMAHLGYRLAARVTHRLPGLRGKLGQSLDGRRHASERWADWATSRRTEDPLVWVHAASVGEWLVAAPVISRLVAHSEGLQVVRSFSSSSAEGWPQPTHVAYADFIPLDEPPAVSGALEAVRPSLVVFARADLWPEFVAQVAARGIPIAVIGATVRPGSRRLHWPTRQVLRLTHRSVSWVGAVQAQDRERYVALGIPRDRVAVTGDPRHDQVVERIPSLNRLTGLFDWKGDTDLLVAGSTDRTDQDMVWDAFTHVSRLHSRARLLIVPHDPSAHNVDHVMRSAAARNITAARWNGGYATPDVSCLVVTSRGSLADLYALGACAYVGGGFSSGVHAVGEPAVFGLPVIVGPRHRASWDAVRMIDGGGAIVLPDAHAAAKALTNTWLRWLGDPAARTAAGLKARQTLSTGAAEITATRLLSLPWVVDRSPHV